MKAVTLLFLGCIAGLTTAQGADARFEINDPYVGIYQGSFVLKNRTGKAEAQIYSLGNGSYGGFIALLGTADGVESPFTVGKMMEFQPGTDQKTHISAGHPNNVGGNQDHPDPRLTYPAISMTGEITPGSISGEFSVPFANRGTPTFSLKRVKTPEPATIGADAPKGAIVLFDGKDHGQWKEAKWKINNGALEVGDGNLVAKQSLTNFVLHLEFRTPNMPTARGQERGNSGVYLRSAFEVQVLDSFGLFPLEDNDCGGIYKVQAPAWNLVNACLPPGEWQTYDITFHDGDQKSMRAPEITVVQNGKTVIDRAKVSMDLFVNGTGGGETGGGFLMLQNHGNPVQYRNIWALPIE